MVDRSRDRQRHLHDAGFGKLHTDTFKCRSHYHYWKCCQHCSKYNKQQRKQQRSDTAELGAHCIVSVYRGLRAMHRRFPISRHTYNILPAKATKEPKVR